MDLSGSAEGTYRKDRGSPRRGWANTETIALLVEDVLHTNETMVPFLAHHNPGMVPHFDIPILEAWKQGGGQKFVVIFG